MRIIFTFLICVTVTIFNIGHSQSVRIAGILDGTLSGGEPKVIELYVDGTLDLSNFDLQRSSNGGAFGSTVNLSGTYTDEFVYLIGSGDTPEFQAAFGTSGDFANIMFENGVISGNGNDGFRIVEDGTSNVVDIFDPSNTNIYLDSWVRRNDSEGPSATYDASEWTFGGNNALDGEDAAGIGAAVPFGAYLLPVNLSAFTAKPIGSTAQLLFTTATEDNNSHFLIQSSTDGRVFKTIGRVEGKGNSNQAVDYRFTDTQPANGINYYRLQQFDFDGTNEFFGPVSVQIRGAVNDAPSIWPVPAKDNLQINFPTEDREWVIEVYDLNGRLLQAKNVQEKTLTTSLDLSQLPAGTYLFRWYGDQAYGQQRFIKQ